MKKFYANKEGELHIIYNIQPHLTTHEPQFNLISVIENPLLPARFRFIYRFDAYRQRLSILTKTLHIN